MSATVGVLTPGKWTNATNQGSLPLREVAAQYLPVHPSLEAMPFTSPELFLTTLQGMRGKWKELISQTEIRPLWFGGGGAFVPDVNACLTEGHWSG